MTVTFTPTHLSGAIKAPPSKSMGHRMLICAGLAPGDSVVRGISDSEDMKATLDLLSTTLIASSRIRAKNSGS